MDGMNYQAGNASLFSVVARTEKLIPPEFVLASLLSSFDGTTAEVIAIKFCERGYYPTTWGRQTKEWVVEQNAAMGIDKATAMAFSTCSLLSGWNNYEGILLSLKERLSHA